LWCDLRRDDVPTRCYPPDGEGQDVLAAIHVRILDDIEAASRTLKLLNQDLQQGVAARESVGGGDQDALIFTETYLITEAVEGRAVEREAAVTFVSEDVFVRRLFSGCNQVRAEKVELLFNRTRLYLGRARDADVDRGSHQRLFRSADKGSFAPQSRMAGRPIVD
jgi:hypothetical protein